MNQERITLNVWASLSWKSISYLRRLCREKLLKSDKKAGNRIYILREELVKRFWIDENSEVYYKDEIKKLSEEIGGLKKDNDSLRVLVIKHKDDEVKARSKLIDVERKDFESEYRKKYEKNMQLVKECFIIWVFIIMFLFLVVTGIISINV